jgi:hypothetical protein
VQRWAGVTPASAALRSSSIAGLDDYNLALDRRFTR